MKISVYFIHTATTSTELPALPSFLLPSCQLCSYREGCQANQVGLTLLSQAVMMYQDECCEGLKICTTLEIKSQGLWLCLNCSSSWKLRMWKAVTEMIISWEGGRRFTFLDLTSVGREIFWSIWTLNQIFFPSLMKALLLKMGKLFVPGAKWEGMAPSAFWEHSYAQVCSQQNQCGWCCYESSSKECCSSAQLWAWLPLAKQWYRSQEGFTFFPLLTQERMAMAFCSLLFF